MREDRITISKALAIIFMVICHAGIPYYLNHFISMFHMPLFFFVSGYCFKDKYLDNKKLFVRNKIKGIYIPFVKWSLLFLFLHNIFYYCNIYNNVYGSESIYGLKEFALNASRVLFTMSETEQLLGGFWFLKQLFIGSIMSLFIYKYFRKQLLVGAIFILLATIVASIINMDIPIFHIGSLSFFSTFFIVMGRVYKQYKYRFSSFYHSLCFLIFVIIGSVFCGKSMLGYGTKDIIPYAIFALLGTVMILNLSQQFSNRENCVKRFLIFVGGHTLEILTWHFLLFKIVSLFLVYLYGLPLEQIAYFPVIPEFTKLFWPLYSCVGILVPIAVIFIRKRTKLDVIKNKKK